MVNNAYGELIDIFRQEGSVNNPPAISLGEIISIEPLVINVNNVPVDKDNLLVSADLLPNYKQKFKLENTTKVAGKVNTTIPTGEVIGTITEVEITEGELQMSNPLQAGDLVAMLPTGDKQLYIVLCKVVKAK